MRRLLDAAFLASGVGSGSRSGGAGVAVVNRQDTCVIEVPTTFPLVFTHTQRRWHSFEVFNIFRSSSIMHYIGVTKCTDGD
jgi:hypothetical protein